MIRYLLLLALAGAACAEKARFDNYRVHSVLPETDEHLDFLRELEAGSDGLMFWSNIGTVNSPVNIMVPPHKSAHFHEMTQLLDLKHEIYIHDVQKLIDEENDHVTARSGTFGWKAYYRLDDIYAWMKSLEEKHPGQVKVIKAGKTYEDRDIEGVKVTFREGNPVVFIESGIHAREWIAPATVTYILNEILTRSDSEFRNLVESYTWYIFPSFNPDGYEYTHTTYRLWRKTRSSSGDGCFGADPNRNWSYMYDEGGVSNDTCSDFYRGSEAFSEVETKSMSEYLKTIGETIDIFLGFHSSGQMLLIPYGYEGANETDKLVHNYGELMQIGERACQKLKESYGTEYKVGNIVNIIYVASGSSMDWVRYTFNTPYTYTYELRDTGRYGFLLPASQIIPTARETLDSVISIIGDVYKIMATSTTTTTTTSPASSSLPPSVGS